MSQCLSCFVSSCCCSHVCDPVTTNWPLNILLSTNFKHDKIIDKSHEYWCPREELYLLLEIRMWRAAPTLSFFKSPREKAIVTLFLLSYRVFTDCVRDACQALTPTVFWSHDIILTVISIFPLFHKKPLTSPVLWQPFDCLGTQMSTMHVASRKKKCRGGNKKTGGLLINVLRTRAIFVYPGNIKSWLNWFFPLSSGFVTPPFFNLLIAPALWKEILGLTNAFIYKNSISMDDIKQRKLVICAGSLGRHPLRSPHSHLEWVVTLKSCSLLTSPSSFTACWHLAPSEWTVSHVIRPTCCMELKEKWTMLALGAWGCYKHFQSLYMDLFHWMICAQMHKISRFRREI